MRKLKTVLATSTIVVLSLCIALMSGCSITSIDSGSSSTSTKSTAPSSSATVINNSVPVNSEEPDTSNYVAYDYTKTTLSGAKLEDYNKITPTTGTQKLLVIPVDFEENRYTKGELDQINLIITGNGAVDTGYWESLSSFWSKSSYGQLSITADVTDAYNIDCTSQEFYNRYVYDEAAFTYKKGVGDVINDAVEIYKNKNKAAALRDLDSNGDGYIDSIIVFYKEVQGPDWANPSVNKNLPSYVRLQGLFWNFKGEVNRLTTTGYKKNSANIDCPTAANYAWFSFKAMTKYTDGVALDSHVLSHEFGHMLGAPDYYNQSTDTSTSPTGTAYSAENPTGLKLMMANNILDNDAYTKMLYRWVSPYYVSNLDDGKYTEITINSHESSGDLIVIADENGWNGSAFDEFVVIELFTPTGLNELDSKQRYAKYNSGEADTGYNKAGVRIWHVDSRLAKYTKESGSYQYTYLTDTETSDGTVANLYASGTTVSVMAHNNHDYSKGEAATNNYKWMSLISAQGRTFTVSSKNNRNFSYDEDLFHAGDAFSLSTTEYITGTTTYSDYYTKNAYFYNGASSKLNNGKVFPWKVEVVSIDGNTSAKIRITKLSTTATVAEETSEYVENEESTWADIDVISVDIDSDSLGNAKKEDVTID